MPLRLDSRCLTPPPDDPSRPAFTIDRNDRAYVKQYANLYWLRLVVLRPRVLKNAKAKWNEAKDSPQHVPRMLDVKAGVQCYIIGTVYMDMPLKPNVLEDLAREHYIAAPPPRRKFCSVSDEIMLEDESGRVRLVGPAIEKAAGTFVTGKASSFSKNAFSCLKEKRPTLIIERAGTIMAALGKELPSGDFHVTDFCYAGLPPPAPITEDADAMNVSDEDRPEEWVAIVSGLEMGDGDRTQEMRRELLVEYLLGELGGNEHSEEAAKITRVILAGNSMAQPEPIDDAATSQNNGTSSTSTEKKPKRYGYDASIYSAKPASALDAWLEQILPSMNVDLMSGESDPVAPTMPQAKLHPAMLPLASGYEGFKSRTNPSWFQIGRANFLGTSGQPLDDIFKYLTSEDRLGVAIKTLEWSHIAPTCPDTLWCYPFSDRDPFILHSTPQVYFISNQSKFETQLLEHPSPQAGSEPLRTRVILVPKFSQTGQVVLVNSRSLEVKLVGFEV
ncbi:BQ5605_C039g11785 [Microbotryum silenes-dioicae]|uniref:BQ5605_C039g11785 protein n=1 Tax=Microbotryum silenes-dioicae TaxID=796604 RepID=A0A2X0MIM8_9BASI|nr:BQ5605_C039g11785 [Microbotryum silenes-dioicae]